jgi:hypothetical protein
VATADAQLSSPRTSAPVSQTPAVFLHLSDIHFSTNVRKYWKMFGNREGDALLWAERLVPRLGVAGVAVTGDITDAKASSCRRCTRQLALPSS